MNEKLRKAIDILKKGGIVIFPTDTAIGIGCKIDDERAIRKLFAMRKRPENKPVLALVDSIEMAEKYLLPIPGDVKEKLIRPFWPGKLTIVLQSKNDKVSDVVRGGTNTLGVRFPNDKLLLELIRGVGVSIIAPSANFSGEKPPFKFEDLDPKLAKLADYVLKGNVNEEEKVSTVIDCSVRPWKIIREGALKISNF